MILTTKARYAVMAMIEIACARDGKVSNLPISLTKIAKSQNISMHYLEQIFRRLKAAQIVDAIKGINGGYFLAKDPKQISLAAIIAAVEEPIKITGCNSENKSCIKNKSRCKAHHLWVGLEKNISNYLESYCLADF